jgi:hypothetical protein
MRARVMNMRIHTPQIIVVFIMMILFAGCGKESTGPEQPEKTRIEYLWLNETITLAPGGETSFARDFIAQDTLHITVSLLNPYPVSLMAVENSKDSTIFSETLVESENFNIYIPESVTHALVIQQNGELARFQLHAKIIRWEYRP